MFFRWNIWFVPALSTSYFQCKFAFFDSFLGKPSKYQKDSDVEALFYKVHEITEILSLSSSWSSLPIDGKKYVQWDPLWKIISASILCHLRQKKKNILQILWLTLHDGDLPRNWFFSTSSNHWNQGNFFKKVCFNCLALLKCTELIFWEPLFKSPLLANLLIVYNL